MNNLEDNIAIRITSFSQQFKIDDNEVDKRITKETYRIKSMIQRLHITIDARTNVILNEES